VSNQGFDNSDMGKAARGATAERQTDHRPPGRTEPDLVASVLTAA
jgi:hypothetical protein